MKIDREMNKLTAQRKRALREELWVMIYLAERSGEFGATQDPPLGQLSPAEEDYLLNRLEAVRKLLCG